MRNTLKYRLTARLGRGRPSRLAATVVVMLLGLVGVVQPASADQSGAMQIDGAAVPWPVTPSTCDPLANGPVDYVLAMPGGSGSLTGCLYGVRQEERFNKGGQLQTTAAEVFVGCLDDRCGSFAVDGFITNRWDGLPGVGNQVNGRCQHKIVSGTGTGGFVGIEGRLDFKDILVVDEDGTVIEVSYDYTGHLRFG